MNMDQASFNNSQRRQSAGFFRWGAPGEPTAVYFHLNTVELLERDAARADKTVAAGVLLGKKPAGQSGWMIENYEPIPDSTFKTTDSLFGDPRQLKGIIDRWRSKPSRRMEVLGFYRSCASSEATLTDDDLSVVSANSDEPESLFLLIEPRAGLTSKATLFLLKDHAVQWQWTLEPFGRSELARKGGTAPPAPVSQPEWTAPLPEVQKPTRPRPEIPAETRSARLREAERAAAERAAEQQPEERSTRPQEFRMPKKWQWAVGAAVIVLLALIALFQLRGHRPSASEASAVDSDLGMKLDRQGNDLRLSWNPDAPAILNAKTAQLIITNANGTSRRIVDLSDSDLVNGAVAYSPSAGDAMLKLQVSSDGAPTISETVQITADALPAASSSNSSPLSGGAAQSGNQPGASLSPEEVSEIERQAGISPRPAISASAALAPSGSRLNAGGQPLLDQSSLRSKPANAPRTSEVKRGRVASGSGVPGAPIASPATRGVPLSTSINVQAERIPVLPALASNVAASVPASASASASAPRPSRRGGTVQPAQLISNVNPIYPADARSSGISGAVELRFKIATNGEVHDVDVVRGPAILAQAAVDAVLNRKYKPAAVDGVPTETDATAIFDFKLN